MTDPAHSQISEDLLRYVREEQFGRQADEFMNSPIGLFLLGHAEAEAMAALNELAESDAADVDHMRELQMIVRRANGLRDWLEQAIAAGKAATAFLDQGD